VDFFKENYGYYKNNSDAFKNSLLTFVGQIKENLDLYEKDKERFEEKSSQTEKIEEKKIAEKDFNDILVKADLAEDQTLLKIYEEAPRNQEIISRINELSMKKYSKIIIYMNEYTRYCAQINSLSDQVNELKKDKIDKDSKINNLNKDIENLKKDKIDKEAQINNLNTQVDNLNKDKIDKEAQINNLNTQVDNLNKDKIDKDKKIRAQEDKISNLQKKVDYMEVILNSLISRKVIKHCINQIINKYKSSIKMIKKTKTEANGEINEFFYIQVINNINSVSVKQSQDLIDLLYEKKDI
jgi:chromosome segregation ATPase